jgi:neutral ceramidase
MNTANPVQAGAATVDISPADSQFLWGYPHVERFSTGVHDPLLASALYLRAGREQLLFIANDVIFVPKSLAARARTRIAEATGVPIGSIMVTATHTHSGPGTAKYLSNEADPAVPEPDEAYLRRLENGIVEAGERAAGHPRPAVVGLVEADGSCVGGNRRDPAGPANPRVPVLAVKCPRSNELLGLMLVCSMHPTVLHEDSTLVSADFPGAARWRLREMLAGRDCPIVFHTGPCGNQSPRHVARENTFAEADRLGNALAENVVAALTRVSYEKDIALASAVAEVELPVRRFPTVEQALAAFASSRSRLEQLRTLRAPKAEIRTAEVDWFGAEETVVLAQAALDGRLGRYARSCMPAEIQVFRVGRWTFVGWQGEMFVEFGLRIMERDPNVHVISLANGELQGYLVTEDAVRRGGYEAANTLFESPASGNLLVEKTLELLQGR